MIHQRPRITMSRRPRGRTLVLCALAIVSLLWLAFRNTAAGRSRHYNGAPVVMVLITDAIPSTDRKAAAYLDRIVSNRQEYADHHGYELAIKQLSSTPNEQIPANMRGWTRLKLLREVVEAHPDTEWFWFLDQDAVIMDPQVSLTKDILANLGTQMLRDVPVVPPDSVIRTLKTATPESVQFVLSQDYSGLNIHSFLLRNGDWAKFLLETWTEPVSRDVWQTNFVIDHSIDVPFLWIRATRGFCTRALDSVALHNSIENSTPFTPSPG